LGEKLRRVIANAQHDIASAGGISLNSKLRRADSFADQSLNHAVLGPVARKLAPQIIRVIVGPGGLHLSTDVNFFVPKVSKERDAFGHANRSNRLDRSRQVVLVHMAAE